MIQFILYDGRGNWKAPVDGVADYTIENPNVIDGSLDLELIQPTVEPSKHDRIVWCQDDTWYEMVVCGVTSKKDKRGQVVEVYCENPICELRCKDIEILTTYVEEPEEEPEQKVDPEVEPTDPSMLLDVIVSGTLWDVGTQGLVEHYKVEEVTALEALEDLIEAQEGIGVTEIEVDDLKVTKRTLSIVQPDTEFSCIRFDYGRNITGIERAQLEDDVFTEIIATGGSYTQEEHVYDPTIDDWLWKEVTHSYTCRISLDELLPIWGWPTKDGGFRHSTCRWNDSSISNEKFDTGNSKFSQEVLDALIEAAKKELNKCGPNIEYTVNGEIVNHERIHVGSLVQVTDYEFDPPIVIEAHAKKVKTTPDATTVVFGTMASTIADSIITNSKAITELQGRSYSVHA